MFLVVGFAASTHPTRRFITSNGASMEPTPTPPTPMFSKAVIDPINTAAWFTMDALWLAKFEWPAYAASALTVLTGVMLLILGRREGRGALYADLGLNCWIVMNTVWLIHDLNDHDTPRSFAAVMECSAPSSSSPPPATRRTSVGCVSSSGEASRVRRCGGSSSSGSAWR